jgi:hypothetical protein
MPVSDCDDGHILRVRRQGLEIVGVCRDHGSPRFSRGDHERVDGGAASGTPAEKRGTTRKGFGDGRRDIASLEEPILDGVAPRVALEALDQDNRWDTGWPQSRLAQRQDQSQSLLRTFGEASHASGIEHQHSG